MIAIFNKFRIGLSSIYVLLAILTASVTLVSCSKDDELEIQNDFPFEVKVMPVPKDVASGQTVEIRITISEQAITATRNIFSATSNLTVKAHCGIMTNHRICQTICIRCQRSSSVCITLRHLPYHNPLRLDFG